MEINQLIDVMTPEIYGASGTGGRTGEMARWRRMTRNKKIIADAVMSISRAITFVLNI